MTPDEFARLVRHINRRRPFLPYRIVFHSGNAIMGAHPEAVMRANTHLFLFYTPAREYWLFAPASVIEVFLPALPATE